MVHDGQEGAELMTIPLIFCDAAFSRQGLGLISRTRYPWRRVLQGTRYLGWADPESVDAGSQSRAANDSLPSSSGHQGYRITRLCEVTKGIACDTPAFPAPSGVTRDHGPQMAQDGGLSPHERHILASLLRRMHPACPFNSKIRGYVSQLGMISFW